MADMETIGTEILVIGAGAAGIRAALAACQAGAQVTMVAKGALTWSGSTFSSVSGGWGIQALVGKERTEDNLEAFYDEIIRVGLGMCDPKLVRILVEESGPRFKDLISYGIKFRTDSQGAFVRTRGCFSDVKRAFVTEDLKNIQQSFQSILGRSRVKMARGYLVDLIIADGRCWGGWAIMRGGRMVRINAKATILANGGGAGIFQNHLVGEEEIGDGYALAYRAGGELENLEFVQFMLGLKENHRRQFLALPDLARPGILCDSEGGDLLETHIPDPQERAKAIDQRQSHAPFSSRDASCLVDIAVAKARQAGDKVLWRGNGRVHGQAEVLHFAHAFNGGVKINEMAESTIHGLFATGEVAAGPHGADRVGGCMMTATQVFGRRAGESAVKRAKRLKVVSFPECREENDIGWAKHMPKGNHTKNPLDIWLRVRKAMNKYAMVLRCGMGFEECKRVLSGCDSQLKEMKAKARVSPARYFETRNMILTGRLIAESAEKRMESLGAHFREDSSEMRVRSVARGV